MKFALRFLVLTTFFSVCVAHPAHVNAQSIADTRSAGTSELPQLLPRYVTTRHRLQLPDHSLEFSVTAGGSPITDAKGAVQAEIGYIAYIREGMNPETRPLAFVINGGPGASSAYLNLLAIGPWRARIDASRYQPDFSKLQQNAETWLDFIDLVFIDPPGTGYSRIVGDDKSRDDLFSVRGDIQALSSFIQRWLRLNRRLQSPLFFVGESYGGFRGPLLARRLQIDASLSFKGLILVSPVLDFSFMPHDGQMLSSMTRAALLPSMAAMWAERQAPLTSEMLREVEVYATGEYLADLLRGVNDAEAIERIAQRLSRYIGFHPELTRQMKGRVDRPSFQRQLNRNLASLLNAEGKTADDPAYRQVTDPTLGEINWMLKPAIGDLYSKMLQYRPEGLYELLSMNAVRQWGWNNSRYAQEALTGLMEALQQDKQIQVLIAHGASDLIAPYHASNILLNQMPSVDPKRLSLKLYGGQHMFYTRMESRAKFQADVRQFIEDTLKAKQGPKAN